MTGDNPYRAFVAGAARPLARARDLPLGGLPPPALPPLARDAPRALIFAPHPDDECVVGALPLRLRREFGVEVIDVAVTQGSREGRRAERWRELAEGCAYLGFGLLATIEGGLTAIKPETRVERPGHWAAAVDVVADILAEHRPRIVFFPHDDDWNRTHLGTHRLVVEALRRQGPDFACHTVETEYWGAMDAPNLMVESGEADVAALVAALSCHAGEVRRNPYHLRLPAWMIDNVRRGGELVLGQGGAAPEFTFATLYRLRAWQGGGFQDLLGAGRAVAAGEDLAPLFSL